MTSREKFGTRNRTLRIYTGNFFKYEILYAAVCVVVFFYFSLYKVTVFIRKRLVRVLSGSRIQLYVRKSLSFIGTASLPFFLLLLSGFYGCYAGHKMRYPFYLRILNYSLKISCYNLYWGAADECAYAWSK